MTQNLQGDFLVQIYVSLVLTAIFPGARWTWVSQYQNVSILYFIGAKDDGSGGDNWSYKTCKAPVKSSQPANQHPTFYKLDALPVAQLTVSEHWGKLPWKKTYICGKIFMKLPPWVFLHCFVHRQTHKQTNSG